MDYWRIHRLGLVSLCAHNRIKAKRKELYQNVVCLHFDTARLLPPPFLYILKSTIVYKVLITSN